MSEAVSWRARRQARYCAVQAVYQHHMRGSAVEDILAEFGAGSGRLKKGDAEYFGVLVTGTLGMRNELDASLRSYLDRELAQLDPVELSILQLGAYELLHQPSVPWKAVLNEMVELAKLFGAEQSHTYVNAVLDKLARSVHETSAEQR